MSLDQVDSIQAAARDARKSTSQQAGHGAVS